MSRLNTRRLRVLATLSALAVPCSACASTGAAHRQRAAGTASVVSHRTSADALVRERIVVARSVRGRPITAVKLGDPDEARRSLVVGVIHGDEPAGSSIARQLERGPPPRASLLWVIEDLNPDGVARHSRQNADGVDLNRNFPWRWRHLGRLGDQQFAGPRPLSEPESRAVYHLILKVRPDVTIWFHQPLAVTDRSGGDVSVERRFASLSGLPLRRLTRYPGSAASWQDQRLPRSTAFVVELPQGPPSSAAAARYTHAVRRVTR